jgi:glutathione S-transferase
MLAMTITFYTNPMSRGQIARWMLEEVGVPYDQVLLDYGTTMKAADYLAINPMGKVPAIVHDGQVITETAAICAYLADVFPDAGLAPLPDERAAYYRWLFFAAGPIEAAVTARSLGYEPPADKQMMAGFGSLDATMHALDQWLEGHDYVCGARFTAADVYVGSQILWGLQFGSVPSLPSFERYADRLKNRPAYLRGKEIDGALIAAAQQAKGG